MSMDVWANVAILLMYESHDMYETQAFRKLTVVNGTPGIWGFTVCWVELPK